MSNEAKLTPGAGGGRRRLKTLQDLRRFLARVTNDLDADRITESKARCFGYLASTMSTIIRDSELEQRVSELENKLEKGGC